MAIITPDPRKGSAQVLIEGKEYSILSQPESDSAVVSLERKALDGSLDLRKLVIDMGRVGSFIRIAHNAIVAGAYGKPEMANLQVQVYNLGIDITKLCDKSASTVDRFSVTSNTIIATLKSTYQNLIDGNDDMALDDLSSMSKLADQMADAADQLRKEFEKQQEKVLGAIKKTVQTKAEEEKETKRIKAEKIKLQKASEEAEQKMGESAARERENKAEREAFSKKEDEAINTDTPKWKKVLGGLASNIPIVGPLVKDVIIDDSSQDRREKAALWKEKALEKLGEEQKARDERYAYLRELNESVANLESLDVNQNQTELAAQFLHQALGALKNLASTMQRAAKFWTDLSFYCRALATDQIKSAVQAGMERDSDAKRLRVWTSTSFKVKAVSYYAKWVALNSMCVEYMGHIKETQADLYKYIVENPDHAQAEASIPDLVKNFRSELAKAQKAVQNEKFEAQKKIEEIEKSTPEIEEPEY